MRAFINQYEYALVIFDKDGCGRENLSKDELEIEVEKNLNINGWKDRNCAIVIEPELENWIWVNSIHVQNSISWEADENIYEWLGEKGFKQKNSPKPLNPKSSFELVLKHCNTPRSSSLYFEIATKASYKKCSDVAFVKMLSKLKEWFIE